MKNSLLRIWKNIKPTVRQFPAFFMLSALTAVFTSIYHVKTFFYNGTAFDGLLGIIKACVWAGIFSLVIQLLIDKVLLVKSFALHLSVQFVLTVLPLASGAFLCRSNSSRFLLIYFGTLSALLTAIVILLHAFQKKSTVIPNIIISEMISGIICGCISSGGSIIALAVQHLIYDFSGSDQYVYPVIYIVAGTFFFPCVFISYVTKREEDITVPRAFTHIFQNVLFPLYVILLAVLYAYLAKCLFLRSMPSGFINPFVSFATACYLLFYLTMQECRNRAMTIFYRFGSLFLFPLIIIQCVAFAIRVNAYGMTGTRQASLFYIIFSIAFLLISLYKNGKAMTSVYPLFGILCLFASISPFNLIDAPARNQYARMKTVLIKNGLLESDDLIPAADGGKSISDEDKDILKSSFDAVLNSEAKRPVWLSRAFSKAKEEAKSEINDEILFGKVFGIPYTDYGESDAVRSGFKVHADDSLQPVDISAWNELRAFSASEFYRQNLSVAFSAGNMKFDITEDLRPFMHPTDEKRMIDLKSDKTEPLVLHQNGFALVLTEVSLLSVQDKNGGEKWDWEIKGYLCR